MEAAAPGLFRCTPNGLLMIPPPESEEPVVVSLVFRPVVWRKAGAALKAAA
jgi:hypothetical protein